MITFSQETIKYIQDHYINNVFRETFRGGIKKETIVDLGISHEIREFNVLNLNVKYDGFNNEFYSTLIDENKDLNGALLSEHKALFKKLKNIYYDENKDDRIYYFDDLLPLNICLDGSQYIIGNFELNESFLGKYYKIELYDEDKDSHSRYLDDVLDGDLVLETIEEYENQLTPEVYKSFKKENDFNNDLISFFKDRYVNVKKASRQGGIPDMTIGENHDVIVELKLGNALAEKQSLCDSVIGQVLRYEDEYTDKHHDRYLMIVIIGNEDELLRNTNIQRTKRIAEKLGFTFVIINVYD